MKKITIFLALIILCFTGLQAQVDRSKAPKPGPAPKIVVGAYESFELPNGLKVIVVENHKLPKVSYSMTLDYDPIMEGKNEGFTAMAGRLIGTGTATRTKDQINDEVDFLGAELSFSSTGLYASCLKKNNEKLLEVMSDALINANFKQEELEKIRKQTISGLAAEKKDPAAIATKVNNAVMFGKNHPYGHSETEETVNAITLEMCKDFYKNYVRPNIAYLAIVGDINVTEAKALITKYFSSWEKSDVPKYSFPTPKAPEGTRVVMVDRPASVQSVIKVGYPVDYRIGMDDFIKAKITNTVLGGGTFRLFNNLREKNGFTYGSYSQLTQDKYVGSFSAGAEVRNSATDSAIVEILAEMKRMRDEKVPADELSMVKNYASGTFALSLENPQTVANFAMNIERYHLPKDYYQNYMMNISAINSDDVQLAAKKYILPENAYILVVGKAEEVAKKLEKFSKSGKVEFYDIDGNPIDLTRKLKQAPAGMTGQQVINKYVEAIGGAKKLEKVKDITIILNTSMQGMSISIKKYQKAPNKLLVEVGANGQIFSKQIFDGTKAAVTSPMGNQDLSGDELEAMKLEAVMNVELQYEKLGYKLDLLGIDEINGKEVFKVELTKPGGKKDTQFFDVTTGLKVRELGEQGATDLSDYREVEGLKFPFVIQQDMGGQAVKMNVESVKINTKLDDSLFKI